LDTETRDLTFIENPYRIFDKVWYDDLTKNPDEIDTDLYKNKIIKVIVTNKTNPYKFDMFINKLEKVGVIDMQIVEDHLNIALEDDSNIVNEAESTIDIFKHHIDQINIANLDKKRLENTIVDLYNEALTIE
jgi:hypothetical protein